MKRRTRHRIVIETIAPTDAPLDELIASAKRLAVLAPHNLDKVAAAASAFLAHVDHPNESAEAWAERNKRIRGVRRVFN